MKSFLLKCWAQLVSMALYIPLIYYLAFLFLPFLKFTCLADSILPDCSHFEKLQFLYAAIMKLYYCGKKDKLIFGAIWGFFLKLLL